MTRLQQAATAYLIFALALGVADLIHHVLGLSWNRALIIEAVWLAAVAAARLK